LRETGESFASTVKSSSELPFLLALFVLVAASARRAGALPGSGMQLLGDTAATVLCACLYAGMGVVYGSVPFAEGTSYRRILRRLGLCLILAVISTCGLMLVLAPAVWDKLFYLRLVAPIAFTAFWCMALLPSQNAGKRLVPNRQSSPSAGRSLPVAGKQAVRDAGSLEVRWDTETPR
jgi:hypothetical protein